MSARQYSPASVTRDNPGGDAEHPVDAALERLLSEGLGKHGDFWKTLEVELPDRKRWKGTRFKRYPTRAAFQYGNKYIALAVVSYTKAEAGDSPSACVKPLLREARKAAAIFDIELGAMHREAHPYALGPRGGAGQMVVLRTSGKYNTMFKRDEYVGAIVAYESWPGSCLVQGYAVRVGSDVMLSRRVVTRWVEDAAPRLRWVSGIREAPAFDTR